MVLYNGNLVVGLDSDSDKTIQSLTTKISEITLILFDLEDNPDMELQKFLEEELSKLTNEINLIRNKYRR